MAKFCTRCGKQCSDNMPVCPMCGQQLMGTTAFNYQTNANQQYGMGSQTNANQQYNSNIMINKGTNIGIGKMVTAQNMIRAVAIILEIMCFLPMFVVSCGNQSENINAVMGVTGYKDSSGMGMDTDGDLRIIMLFVIPIILFIIWFLRKRLADNILSVIAMVVTASDMILWNVFKSNVNAIAVEYNCEFQTTAWYTINFVLLLMLLLLLILILLKKITLDWSLDS